MTNSDQITLSYCYDGINPIAEEVTLHLKACYFTFVLLFIDITNVMSFEDFYYTIYRYRLYN